jgi:hypothetical protein
MPNQKRRRNGALDAGKDHLTYDILFEPRLHATTLKIAWYVYAGANGPRLMPKFKSHLKFKARILLLVFDQMINHALEVMAVLGRPCLALLVEFEENFILPRFSNFTLPPVRRGYRL